MAFTDDSDLSDSLSSAGSTVPLPSSNLASRANSVEPAQIDSLDTHSLNHTLDHSPSTSAQKSHRIRTARSIKLNSAASPLNALNPPDEPSKPPKKSRASSRPNPHSPDIHLSDRLVKAESLPPPSLKNPSRRSSLCSSLPASANPNGLAFQLAPSSPYHQLSSLDQLEHPSTSHGHLPLFEQPVLLQGARPRRPHHPAPQRPNKSRKSPIPKLSVPKSLSRPSDRSGPSHHPTVTASPPNQVQADKDDESSLTEQSSSDDEDRRPRPARPAVRSLSPSPPHSRSLARPYLPQAPSGSSDPILHSPLLALCSQSRPQLQNPLPTVALPVICSTDQSNPRPPHPSPHLDRSPNPSQPPHLCLSPQEIQPMDVIQQACESNPQPDAMAPHPGQPNGRDASEESALTPDPEEDRPSGVCHQAQPKPAGVSGSDHPSQLPSRSPPTHQHATPSAAPAPLPVANPERTPHSPAELHTDGPPSAVPLPSRPRPPNIIPPSAFGTQFLGSACTIVDQGSESGLPSAVSTSGPARSPTSPLVLLGDGLTSSRGSGGQRTEAAADEVLDGEPITADEMMEFEMEQGSTGAGSALDAAPAGVLGPASDEDGERQTRAPAKESRTAESDSGAQSKKRVEGQKQESNGRGEKPIKATKTAHENIVYEHDDHVRRREDALEAMVKIEIMFAKVRDRLYAERMADVERETLAIHQGSHPELNEYSKMLTQKRDARLSLAKKMFSLKSNELAKKREAAMSSVWSRWYESKSEMRDGMIAETLKQSKMVERGKRLPDLRYNVEVQMLPRPIIQRLPTKRAPSRKRVRLDPSFSSYSSSSEGGGCSCTAEAEEMLAIELQTAVSSRASVNLSSLTAEESVADLLVMRPQAKTGPQLEPVDQTFRCSPSVAGVCRQGTTTVVGRRKRTLSLESSGDEARSERVVRAGRTRVSGDGWQSKGERRPTLDAVMAQSTPERVKMQMLAGGTAKAETGAGAGIASGHGHALGIAGAGLVHHHLVHHHHHAQTHGSPLGHSPHGQLGGANGTVHGHAPHGHSHIHTHTHGHTHAPGTHTHTHAHGNLSSQMYSSSVVPISVNYH